jgi:hypothetical protein
MDRLARVNLSRVPAKIWFPLAGKLKSKQNARKGAPNLQIYAAILQIFPKDALVESGDFNGLRIPKGRFCYKGALLRRNSVFFPR